jgi:hypothetical protein
VQHDRAGVLFVVGDQDGVIGREIATDDDRCACVRHTLDDKEPNRRKREYDKRLPLHSSPFAAGRPHLVAGRIPQTESSIDQTHPLLAYGQKCIRSKALVKKGGSDHDLQASPNSTALCFWGRTTSTSPALIEQ